MTKKLKVFSEHLSVNSGIVNEFTTFMFKIPKELIKKFFLKFLDMEKLPVKQQKNPESLHK